MFEYLKDIDVLLVERYNTVVRNIKSKSNSFYDSYLDLMEQFIKFVAINEEIEYDAKMTCGQTLKNPKLISLFIENIGVDKYSFDKMSDYTAKVNKHKHFIEKTVSVETVVNYMKVLYVVTSQYAAYKGIICNATYEAEFFVEIFGLTERENIALKNERDRLQDELKASAELHRLNEQDLLSYQAIVAQKIEENSSLDEQNAALQRQVSKLKDIKLSSMEEKLNRTIDLLNELTVSVVENRAISYAIGDSICGRGAIEKRTEQIKESMPAIKQALNKANTYIDKGIDAVKGINSIVEAVAPIKK